MARKDSTSAIIDGLLKLCLGSGALALTLMAPNALIALDKPLQATLNKFDQRSRERELRRITRYMKSRKLVTGNYEHGLIITNEGRKRAERANFDRLAIQQPTKWDKAWRLVIFDIPENKRQSRVALTSKLRILGFQQLQQSTWIYPFPCRQDVVAVTEAYGVSKYVTYIKTDHIDHEEKLVHRFRGTLNSIID